LPSYGCRWAPLPLVDYPTITVSANMPGASPATVATPLERHLGIIADVTEMSLESAVGTTRITLQFTLNRSLDGAARDLAINAARADLPWHDRQVPELLAGRMTRLGRGHLTAKVASAAVQDGFLTGAFPLLAGKNLRNCEFAALPSAQHPP
jgi:hypothetical protein